MAEIYDAAKERIKSAETSAVVKKETQKDNRENDSCGNYMFP